MDCIIATFWGKVMAFTLPLALLVARFVFGSIPLRSALSLFEGVPMAQGGIGSDVPATMESISGGNETSSSSIESSHACNSSGDSESGYMRMYPQSIKQKINQRNTDAFSSNFSALIFHVSQVSQLTVKCFALCLPLGALGGAIGTVPYAAGRAHFKGVRSWKVNHVSGMRETREDERQTWNDGFAAFD